VAGSCEYDSGPSDFFTGEECGDQPNNCELLEEAPFVIKTSFLFFVVMCLYA
jgi:hypothetical protein